MIISSAAQKVVYLLDTTKEVIHLATVEAVSLWIIHQVSFMLNFNLHYPLMIHCKLKRNLTKCAWIQVLSFKNSCLTTVQHSHPSNSRIIWPNFNKFPNLQELEHTIIMLKQNGQSEQSCPFPEL